MALNQKSFGDIITFTRASAATRINSLGVRESVASNVPRIDYDPITLAVKGLLVEEQRTNVVRNSMMVGAVAGTPGTLPTSWGYINSVGLSTQIVGFGVDAKNNSYIDIRLFGTTSAAGGLSIIFEQFGTAAAAQNEYWSSSVLLALAAGSLSNINSTKFYMQSGNSSLATLDAVSVDASGMNGVLSPYSAGMQFGSAGVAYVRSLLSFIFPNGAAIDATFRIAAPQIEKGESSTSFIPTSGAQATRAADVAQINMLSPWYNQAEGSVFSEWMLNNDRVDAVVYQLDNAASNLIRLRYNSGGTGCDNAIINGGVIQGDVLLSGSQQAFGVVQKNAHSFSGGNASRSSNGAAAVTGSPPIIPTSSVLRIGGGQGIDYLNGWIRKLRYYPKRLTNAELQALTA